MSPSNAHSAAAAPMGLRLAPTTPEAARSARTGLAMSVATFAMAAASAIQAVLYLSEFGTSARTDGFFVTFALYTTFGVFSQSLRLTAVPLLIGERARLAVREFAGVLALIAVPVLLATTLLAGGTAALLAPGLDTASRAVTQSALPVLGVATVLQLWAAGAATVLAVRDRFGVIASSYIVGSTAGLATYVALERTAGELVLGWSMLAMALVTCGWMLAGLRGAGGLGEGGDLRLRALVARTGLVLGRTAIYLVVNMLFVVTLAAASGATSGATTVLSYSYLFASYLVAGTGMALGMSRIPDMTRVAAIERRAVIGDTVPPGFRYAMMIVAPALAGLIAAGASLIHALFPSSLDAAGVHDMRVFAALLAAWTVAALLVSFLLPAMYALGRARLVNLLAIPLLLVHIAATLAGRALWGVEGAVGAFVVAPALFAALMLVLAAGGDAGPLARRLGRDAAVFLLLAAGSFGLGALVGSQLTSGLAAALLTTVVGTAVYAAGLALVARRQVLQLLGALRPAQA